MIQGPPGFSRHDTPLPHTTAFPTPGIKAGGNAAFSNNPPGGEETPAVLVHCRTSDNAERSRLRDEIRDKVRSITGMNCVVELVPPRTLPRTSSGKLSRSKARNLYLSGEIQPYDVAACRRKSSWGGIGRSLTLRQLTPPRFKKDR